MNQSMHQSSARVFTHNLTNLAAILKLAAREARTRNIDPTVLLNARLAPDMLPLTRQVQIATDHAKGCCARLAGVEVPPFEDTESTFAELDSRIKKTLVFIRSLKASQFTDSETRKIVMELAIGKIEFAGADYLNGWALPNFYFHYTTAYNILRHNGLDIGKREFLGTVPGAQMSGKIARMMGVKAARKPSGQR